MRRNAVQSKFKPKVLHVVLLILHQCLRTYSHAKYIASRNDENLGSPKSLHTYNHSISRWCKMRCRVMRNMRKKMILFPCIKEMHLGDNPWLLLMTFLSHLH